MSRSRYVYAARIYKHAFRRFFPPPEGEANLDPNTTLAQLAKVLEDPKVAKVNQNIKYDLLALRGKGVNLQGVVGDPMLADYLT